MPDLDASTPTHGLTSIVPAPGAPIPVRRVHWKNAVRIIPALYPPIDLFRRVAAPDYLDAVHAIESSFNPRLRETGPSTVPKTERIVGPGAGYVMAAFTHISPDGSRFSNGTYGVFYAAQREATAIAETRYHRERFMRATNQPRIELDMRVLTATIKAPLHDLRRMRPILPDVYRLDDYTAAQLLGGALRAGGSSGVVYDSVRHDGGKCAGVFRARAVSHCREIKRLRYVWNGTTIEDVLEIRRV